MTDINTEDIYNGLFANYINNSKLIIQNVFLFHRWESDLVIKKNNDYLLEIEVKSSKQDFKKDFEKEKHELFKRIDKENLSEKYLLPNKFYFASPKDLITEKEIPDYAGLIYIDKIIKKSLYYDCYYEKFKLKKIKEAKFLHKKTYELDSILLKKAYHNFLSERSHRKNIQEQLKDLKNEQDRNRVD